MPTRLKLRKYKPATTQDTSTFGNIPAQSSTNFKYHVTSSKKLGNVQLIYLNLLITHFLVELARIRPDVAVYSISWKDVPLGFRLGDNKYGADDEIAFALIDYFEDTRQWKLRIEYFSKKLKPALASDNFVFTRF